MGSFPFCLQPPSHCFWPGGIAAGSHSGEDCVSVAGIVALSPEATQSQAHSFVSLDHSDKFTSGRSLRLHLHMWLVADLGRCTLRECGCQG
jgi:hypothetical protein